MLVFGDPFTTLGCFRIYFIYELFLFEIGSKEQFPEFWIATMPVCFTTSRSLPGFSIFIHEHVVPRLVNSRLLLIPQL